MTDGHPVVKPSHNCEWFLLPSFEAEEQGHGAGAKAKGSVSGRSNRNSGVQSGGSTVKWGTVEGYVLPVPKDETVAEAPWKIYGVGASPKPDWLSEPVHYVQCDLLDREDTFAKLCSLVDVTHLFWVIWTPKNTEEENRKANSAMFRNVLDVLMLHAKGLEHICLQTGAKHYLGPFDSLFKAEIPVPEPPFEEKLPRLPVPNFYYDLEDILLETVKQKEGLTWNVHRPNVIFRFAPRNFMNCLGALCVYATICNHEGLPFAFPGNKNAWEMLQDACDAELIAEQEIWAFINAKAKNQTFNITNGDVFKRKHLWPMLAKRFGLEPAPYNGKGFSLAEMMKGKGSVWDAIVAKNSLFPSNLEDVGQFWFIDTLFNIGPDAIVLSMNKSKEFGFLGYRNTERSLLYWVDKMKDYRIVP